MADPAFERDAITLFEAMLGVPEDERDAWLDRRVPDQPDLRAKLEAMRAADRTGSLHTGGAIDDAADEAPWPDRLGGYRLRERIGRGGMGSVFAAERDMGDFEHLAAIKIIKPGLLSDALIDRFRRERQTLAQLSHPNIARLFGGGETDDGAPYIIMELIGGQALPAWIETQKPSLEQRLALFEEACGAVAFAHSNLVVHRDITPSNIIVTHEGHAKLIDFGIARPLDDGDEAGSGVVGSLRSLMLTPGYSAPERQSGDATTTLADIFSLGRVLDRLVAPEDMNPELQAIVAKATAPDPAERYFTAEALADDVAAYRTGGPVHAYGAGRRYLIRKFAARHRLAVWTTIAAIAALIAALALVATLYARAESARRAEAARFEQLRSLARFMVFDLNGRLERVAGNADARLALVERAQHYLVALARTPNAAADVRLEAARGLVALAKVQGVPGQPNLGQEDAARANLRLAIDLASGPGAAGRAATPILVDALVSQAMLKTHLDADPAVGRAQLMQAAILLDKMPPPTREWSYHNARRALRSGQLEIALLDQKPKDVLRLANLLEREIESWPGGGSHAAAAAFDRANADYYRGIHGYLTDALAPSMVFFARAEGELSALDRARPNDPQTLYLLSWVQYTGYGAALGVDSARAARFLRGAEKTLARLTAIEPNDRSLIAFAGNIGAAKAQLLSDEGRNDEAIAEQRKVIARYTTMMALKPTPATQNRIGLANLVLGNIEVRGGDRAGACSAYENSYRIVEALKREGKLLGFIAHFEDALANSVALCGSGAPLARFTILE